MIPRSDQFSRAYAEDPACPFIWGNPRERKCKQCGETYELKFETTRKYPELCPECALTHRNSRGSKRREMPFGMYLSPQLWRELNPPAQNCMTCGEPAEKDGLCSGCKTFAEKELTNP